MPAFNKGNWGARARIGLFIVASEAVPEAEWWRRCRAMAGCWDWRQSGARGAAGPRRHPLDAAAWLRETGRAPTPLPP